MEGRNELVSALSVQLSMACIFCTAVYWFAQAGQTGLIFPLALLPYGPAVYGLNRLFLRRERSARALVLFNCAVGLALFGAMAADIGWGRWWTLVSAAVFCAWLTVRGAGLVMEPPALPRVILCLDGSLVTLILFTAYGAAVQVPSCQLIPACIGCAGALLGLMLRRVGGGLGARGWAFVGAAFLALFALVFLLVSFAAAPAGQGVTALWSMLTAAVRSAADLLGRALIWLLSLLPAPTEEGELAMEPTQMELPEDLGAAEANPIFAAALAVLMAAGALALAVWCLRMLGKVRVGGRRVVRTVRPSRRRSALSDALRRLLASWAERICLAVWLVRNRNTPAGLFYLLVRRCRMGPWRKRRGETPREFLLRLRRSAEGDRELADALDGLIPAVDAALYAPPEREGSAVPHARLIRRRVGASVRRQFVRDSLARLPWRGRRAAG